MADRIRFGSIVQVSGFRHANQAMVMEPTIPSMPGFFNGNAYNSNHSPRLNIGAGGSIEDSRVERIVLTLDEASAMGLIIEAWVATYGQADQEGMLETVRQYAQMASRELVK
jgi:hypothetical protein